MDLPTYTNIWRIEKRLYKLYDFRLPMPLPVGQITVFAAIAIPYVVLLTLLNVPFSHSLVWLYVLPPGLLTWLVTRPVLEGKRLPELVRSQLRFLAEPRVWCRMAPLAESDVVIVTSRVWRLSAAARGQVDEAAARSGSRSQSARRLGRVRPSGVRGRRAGVASAAAAAADAQPQAQRRQIPPQWQAPRQQAPSAGAEGQQMQVQGRSGPGRSAPARSARAGAASARTARAAAVRARASAMPSPEPLLGRTVPLPRPGIAAGQDPARAAAAPPAIPGLGRPVASARPAPTMPPARPAAPLPHPPVRPVGPDQPVVLRDRPLRSPTAPPTRSPAAAGPGPAGGPAAARPAVAQEPATWPEPLSIPRQAASPDAAEPAAMPPALVPPAPVPVALAPAPHSEVAEETPVRAQAAPVPAQAARFPEQAVPVLDPEHDAEAFTLSESTDREPVHLDPARPNITVVSAGGAAELAPTVERMLAGPSVRRGDGISGRVMVVPGGHRPGKPDQLQRDRARAQLPVSGPRRVVVLGCTVGAGQTMTALLTGEVLASLRPEPIAALDLNPGASSLAQRARLRPAPGQVTGSPRLAILGPQPTGADLTDRDPAGGEASSDPADPATGLAHAVFLFERATAGHQIVLADPSTTVVPRLLSMADQLILVAPASAAAPRAIGMTFEWLDAHGHADLASEAIMVMNGVSRRSTAHVEQAERGCIGRCRAIVRVPWDDQLGAQSAKRADAVGAGSQWAGPIGPATAGAYTALAGVLVVALADQAGPDDGHQGDGELRDPSANSTAGHSTASNFTARTGWGPR